MSERSKVIEGWLAARGFGTERYAAAADLLTVLDAADLRLVPADAVVIPRDAIPDGLVERLETRRGAHRSTQDKIDQIAAARLLSGGAR